MVLKSLVAGRSMLAPVTTANDVCASATMNHLFLDLNDLIDIAHEKVPTRT
jgi:hypothetical protein